MNITEAIHTILFATTDITDIVGQRIFYDRGPVGTVWPLIHYFDVADSQGVTLDYNSQTIQFSVWAIDKYTPSTVKKILIDTFTRYHGTVSLSGGRTININWSRLSDAGQLPTIEGSGLYGQYIRVEFRYRGNNLGA